MDILSFDMAENILSCVDSPRDLRALALTSRYWAALIVPRHIQYRKLHIGSEDHLLLWTHLAKRKDLAKNIREVCMTNVRRRGERRPTTLVSLLEELPEDKGEATFLRAFQNFERLESFTWRPHKCPSFMDPHHNHKFLDILSNARYLTSLDLSSTSQLQRPKDETLWKMHPVFSFRNLTRLDLSGFFWRSFNKDFPLTPMLLQCPDLEELSLFFAQDSTPFVKCFFPRLRKLSIVNARGAGEGVVMKFIQEHKTVQELTWYPLGDTRLLPGSLPALQKITSNHIFLMDILQDGSVPKRALRRIDRIHLDSTSMKILEQIDGSQVRELFLCPCGGVQNIRRIANLFPAVTTLGIPDESMYQSYCEDTIDDEIFTLSLFPALECILTARIWTMISKLQEWEARQDAITKLAHACLRLKLIMPPWEPERKITLSRDGERISWMEDYPQDQ